MAALSPSPGVVFAHCSGQSLPRTPRVSRLAPAMNLHFHLFVTLLAGWTT